MLRDDQLALLKGLPQFWRYAMTGGSGDAKRCFESEWNEKGNGRTLEDVIRINESPRPHERWLSRKLIGLGVITGEESNGLLVIDFDGYGSEAVRAFRKHFRRNPSELPATVANISGKKGRAKVYFSVPPHWWPQFEARSTSWRNAEGNVVLEAIWQNGTGRGRHAVIVGDHPDSSHQNPLYYRWIDGFSPSEVGVAEAPEWLLLGIIAQLQLSNGAPLPGELRRQGSDDATPWERLSVADRIELIESALEKCPNREGRSSGTYEQVRRILAGMINELGLELAVVVATNSPWDKGNEWDSNNSTEKVMRSLAKSKVTGDQRAHIASLFHFARTNGWESPVWAMIPQDTSESAEQLRKLIHKFNAAPSDSAEQAVIIGRAKRDFGVEPEVLRRLALEEFLGNPSRVRSRTLSEIEQACGKNNVLTDVIDGFLGRRVHVMAGASHSGKTTLACFLANRVVTGASIDVDSTRHSCSDLGKVLIFTSDCSDADMMRDLALEGVTTQYGSDRVRVCSGASFGDMLGIVQLLDEFSPDLVIYDCLTSMACSDIHVGDPAYADPIRMLVRHNGMAWRKCAHLILHHTSRDEPTRFSGTEQIKAATEEMWIYYPPELLKWKKGTPRPSIGATRHLVFEKSRSGYAGRSMAITRNPYQGHWQFTKPGNDNASPLEKLTVAFRKVHQDDWRIASEWRRELDLEFKDRSLRRYLEQLEGNVLESSQQLSRVTGRRETHYRPTQVIRDAAKAMLTSRGEGINEV